MPFSSTLSCSRSTHASSSTGSRRAAGTSPPFMSRTVAEPLADPCFELEGHRLVAIEVGHTDTDDTTILHVPSIGLIENRKNSEQRHARQFGKPGRELVLKPGITRFPGRPVRSAVMPVAAADHRRGIIADRKPRLRAIPLLEIVRRSRAAHLCRDPAGNDGMAQNVGPVPRDREGECRHIELAVRVRLAGVPAPLDPVDVAQRGGAAAMHAATQTHYPLWPHTQRSSM